MIPSLGVWALALLASVIPLEEKRFGCVSEQQSDTTCGIAAVSSLASVYWGMDVTEEALLTFFFGRAGGREEALQEISLYDLQLLLEHLGFTAGGFGLNYGQLVQAAWSYGPLICHLQAGEGHFVIFLGEVCGFAILGDPARGCLAVPVEEFISTWSGTALAVFHPDQSMQSDAVAATIKNTEERLSTLSSWCLR